MLLTGHRSHTSPQAQHSVAVQSLDPLKHQASLVLCDLTDVAAAEQVLSLYLGFMYVHIHRAVQLLSSCLMFTEEQVSHHLPKLLPALGQVCMSAVLPTQQRYHCNKPVKS